MNFSAELEKKYNTVSGWLSELAPHGNGLHGIVFDAANYSLTNGGKRIRPILCLAVCELLGGEPEAAKHFACAAEFIHTYSLIHDDLPCMDNDAMRRGKPTCHRAYGEAVALLAGDGLLTYAFLTAAKSSVCATEGIIELAAAAGMDGMIGGQIIDINGVDNAADLTVLHSKKTGALITVAARLGAISAFAEADAMCAVTEYSKHLGLAFQIKDDILDVTGSTEALGKTTGSDERCDKTTFITLYGVDGARQRLAETTDNAKAALAVFGERAAFLSALADHLRYRDK